MQGGGALVNGAALGLGVIFGVVVLGSVFC